MPGPPQKLSILLTGSVDNRSEREMVQPVAQQGTIVKLRASTNTRLSVRPGGIARSPKFTEVPNPTADLFVASKAGTARSALVSAANRKATIALIPGASITSTPQVIADAGRAPYGTTNLEAARPTGTGSQKQANLVRVSDAGSIGQRKPITHVAVAYNEALDQVWYAYWEAQQSEPDGTPTHGSLIVSATRADGTALVAPTFSPIVSNDSLGSVSLNGYSVWAGLTSHGVNGVLLWFTDPTTNQVKVRPVSIDARSALVYPASIVAAMNLAPNSPTHGIDVCSGGTDYAYLVCTQAGSVDDCVTVKWSAVSNSYVIGHTLPGAALGGGQVAISSEEIRGTRHVAVCAGSVTNNVTTMALYTTNLALAWPAATKPRQGIVGVGFADDSVYLGGSGYEPRAVYVVGAVTGSFDTTYDDTSNPLVDLQTYHKQLSNGADRGSTGDHFAWRSLQAHVAQWSPRPGITVPVMAVAPAYGATGAEIGGANYADDPSLDVYVLDVNDTRPALIARLGVVRGIQSPVRPQAEPRLASKSLVISGQRAFIVYRQSSDAAAIGQFRAGSPARYVTLDMSPSQPSVAHDRDGSAFVAGALPLQWDGNEIFELSGVLRTPHIGSWGNGGGGLADGVYSYRAITRWTDSSGLTHRSRPSRIMTFTEGSGTNGVFVGTSVVESMSSQTPDVLVYSTETNGKTLHLMAILPNVTTSRAAASAIITAANPMIYTTEADGAELAPQPPPPAHDIAIIGQRCWILDAEVRGRWVYSKYRIAGIGYEFHPALELIIPSGAGDGMAAREWNGQPVFLCERAVYATSGDGPLNNGQGGSYAPPVKLSDYGCSNTASVAVFPGGIIWQFGDRFVLLNGNGINLVPDFVCTHDVSAAVVLTRYSEVLFFSSTVAEIRVFNYEFSRWTIWDSETLAETVQQASLLPWDPDTVLVYSQSSGLTRRLDCVSISAAAHMTFDTDWLLLGGDFQDNVELLDLVFGAVVNGPHGIEIKIFTDYNDATPTTALSWDAAKITELAGTSGRYTLRCDPVQPNFRAVRVLVRDVVAAGANTQGMGPRALTLSYQINGQLFEDAFLQDSHK